MDPMMLRELYQEVIIDHNRHPRHCHDLPEANKTADGFNPLCGDKIKLFLYIDDNNVIQKAAFTGNGCAISMASASLMMENIQGMPLVEATRLFDNVHQLLTDENSTIDADSLGKLTVLAGVKAFPARVKCATLAWHTLNNVIHDEDKTASTE